MSVTFTKLFSSITASTVWCEPSNTRIVWITMLAMADSRGRVWASIPGLAGIARVPVEDARIAIERFLSPDEDSRSKEHEGRRIEEIDGGWRLINHEKYRAIRDEESVKERKRRYIADRRAKERAQAKTATNVPDVDHGRHNAEAEAEAIKPVNPIPKALRASGAGKSVETWNAYSAAYQRRYGVPPVRNAKVNGQMARLVEALGAEEAPQVAAFYVTHNGGLYMSSGHCGELLLRDAAKLRTEWFTGRKVTKLEIKSLEQVDSVAAQIERVGRQLEEEKRLAAP